MKLGTIKQGAKIQYNDNNKKEEQPHSGICEIFNKWILYWLECADAPLIIIQEINVMRLEHNTMRKFIFLAFIITQVDVNVMIQTTIQTDWRYFLLWLHTQTSKGIKFWFVSCVSCVCADPGPGLLHDNVLPGSESGNLLRLAVDLRHPAPLGCFTSERDRYRPTLLLFLFLLLLPFLLFLFLLPKQTLFSNACPSCDIRSRMSLVHDLSSNYQQAQCQCNTWVGSYGLLCVEKLISVIHFMKQYYEHV